MFQLIILALSSMSARYTNTQLDISSLH